MNKNYFTLLAALAVSPFVCAQELAEAVPAQDAVVAQEKASAEQSAVKAEAVPATASVPAAKKEAVPATASVPAEDLAEQEKEQAKDSDSYQKEKVMKNLRLLRLQADLKQTQIAFARQEESFKYLNLDFQAENLASKQRLADARLKSELAVTAADTRRLKTQSALKKAQVDLENYKKNRALALRDIEARIAMGRQENAMGQLQLAAKRAVYTQASRGVAYDATPMQLDEPFVDGTLYISNRRIDMNGPVTMEMAKYVCDRLAFYDNQDTKKPIFVVIDSSPGGSVFAGYLMLKAVESCRAPVHVVVKSYAASMAAVFTTLAPYSYCLEQTIILHHQPSASVAGNMTVIKQDYDLLRMWTGNIFNRVCEKIGVTYDQFVKDMYTHYKSGDWLVFGKEAQERKWVGNVATRIVETGSQIKPDVKTKDLSPALSYELPEQHDEFGRAYVELPALESGDAWWITDPRGTYRVNTK